VVQDAPAHAQHHRPVPLDHFGESSFVAAGGKFVQEARSLLGCWRIGPGNPFIRRISVGSGTGMATTSDLGLSSL
jgi:hypothetical protein